MVSFLILTIHLQNPLPQKYEELVNEFLLLRESNDNNAYDLCYFKSGYESTKCMMIEVAPILAEVKLEKTEKINDCLYAIFIRYTLEAGVTEECYSFVGTFKDTNYIFINPENIPDELKDNYNESKFSIYRIS